MDYSHPFLIPLSIASQVLWRHLPWLLWTISGVPHLDFLAGNLCCLLLSPAICHTFKNLCHSSILIESPLFHITDFSNSDYSEFTLHSWDLLLLFFLLMHFFGHSSWLSYTSPAMWRFQHGCLKVSAWNVTTFAVGWPGLFTKHLSFMLSLISLRSCFFLLKSLFFHQWLSCTVPGRNYYIVWSN